jgi:hypothetical protein
MEIRLARHGRHIAIVSIDNQPRLNALTRHLLSNSGAYGTSWSATPPAAESF